MGKKWLVVSALLVLPASGQTQGQTPPNPPPAEYKIPADARDRANPVKPTPESLARAKKVYAYDCAVCHGKNGDGKGDVAEMKGITNFTDPAALKDRTDGEIFYIIQKGKGEMPGETGRAKTDELWNLVNYVRSFAKKPQ